MDRIYHGCGHRIRRYRQLIAQRIHALGGQFLAVYLGDISRRRLNDNPNRFAPDKLFGLWRRLIF